MNVYVKDNSALNQKQVELTIKFLREAAKTAQVEDDDFGICWNFSSFLLKLGVYRCNGYEIVSHLSVGFPDVAMYEDKADDYPLKNDVANGYPASDHLWEVGNRRTQLCTHIADRLQEFLDKA